MDCIKITYYKMEGGDQKKVTLPSIYLPDSITLDDSKSLSPDVIMELLLSISKDSTHDAYVPIQQMLRDNIVSSSIKRSIEEDVALDSNAKDQAEPQLITPTEVLLDKLSNTYRDTVNFTNSSDLKNQHFKQQSLNKSHTDNLMNTLLGDTSIDVVFNGSKFDHKGEPLEDGENFTQGLYYPEEGVIMIYSPDGNIDQPFRDESVKDALIHELAHYHTVANFKTEDIDASTKVLSEMNDAFIMEPEVTAILDAMPGGKLNNAKELVAYYTSNAKFAETVDSIDNTFRDRVLSNLFAIAGNTNINTLLNVLSKRQGVKPAVNSETDGSIQNEDVEINTEDVNYDDLSDGNDIDEDTEDDQSEDSGPSSKTPLEMNVNFGNLFTQVAPIAVANREDANKIASTIRATFNNAVDSKSKNSKYTRNYDRAINLAVYNRSLAHRLQQNDIVLVPVGEKQNGKWVNSEVKSTYAPIISSFINSETQKLVFQVATRSGKTQFVDADDIKGFRKFLGNLNEKAVVTSQEKLASIWANYGALAFGEYGFTHKGNTIKVPKKGRLYSKMTFDDMEFESKVYDNEVSTYVSMNIDRNSNANLNKQEGVNKVYTGRDDTYDVKNFENLKQGDVVKVVSKDKEGKKITYYAPIVKVYGDKIEVVKSPGKGVNLTNLTTHQIDKSKISGVYMLHENHSDRLADLESKLGSITEDGFYNKEGLMKNSFLNITREGLPSAKPNWNDLDSIIGQTDKKAFFENYNNWRKALSDTEYKALREKDLDPTTTTYLRYARAVDRRMAITDKLGVGGYVQLEAPQWLKEEEVWIKNKAKPFKPVYGVVLSKNGKWLTVRVANQSFTESGEKIPGEFTYKTVKVNVLDTHPSMEEKGAKYAIRATYYDNTEHVPMINYFNDLKSETKTNWKNFDDLINYHQGKKNIDINSDDYSQFGIKSVGASYRSSKTRLQDGYIPSNATKMADYYDMRFFPEDSSVDSKLKNIARLKPGSIILTEVDEDAKTNAKYTTSIVLGFDERSGLPLVGYSYADKNNSGPDMDFNNVRTNYVVGSVHPSKVIGVGYSKANHKDANGNVLIQIDDYIKRDNIKRAEMYVHGKKLNTYDNLKDAEDKQKKLAKYDTSIVEIYVDKSTGRRTKTKPEDNYTTSYAVMFNNLNKTTQKKYQTDTNSNYRTVYGNSFKDQNTKYILDQILKPGDVIVESYNQTKDDTKTKYNELVIDEIVGDMIYATAYYPKKGTSGSDLDSLDNYEAYPRVLLMKPENGLGLPNISKVQLNFYRNKEDNNARKKRFTELQSKYTRKQSNNTATTAKSSIDPAVTNGLVSKKVGQNPPSVNKAPKTASSTAIEENTFLSKASEFKSQEDVSLQDLQTLGDRLSDLYNVPVNYMSSEELFELFDTGGTYDISRHRAFVKDGVIYINTDFATLAEPVHEMGHLVLQGLRLTENAYYSDLMAKVRTHPFYAKVAGFYPELSTTDLDEEVFVTILGEHYNSSKNNKKTENWEQTNPGFFSNLFSNIKKLFAKLFGISDHKFFKVNDFDLMNSSFNDILSNFSNKLTNGEYIKEVDMATAKYSHLTDSTFLKNSKGRRSSFYTSLMDAGFGDKFASDSWINSKSSTFAIWHGDSLLVGPDGEPKLMFTTSNPYVLSETDVEGVGNAVLVRGEHIINDDGTITLNNLDDTKSIYELQIKDRPELKIKSIEEFAVSENLPMIGNLGTVRATTRRLSEQFGNHTFEPKSLADGLYYVKHYVTPYEHVLNLRNELFTKNLIQSLC